MPQDKGPVKDLYNMQDNPQFSFVTNSAEQTEVYVLLSRHITDSADFCDNKEFITVHVYRGGKRVYYPEDPYFSGTKINRLVSTSCWNGLPHTVRHFSFRVAQTHTQVAALKSRGKSVSSVLRRRLIQKAPQRGETAP